MIDIRNSLQEKWSNIFIDNGRWGILNLSPRTGKTKVSIKIFEKFEEQTKLVPTILIAYPDKNIETSWKDDFKKFNYLYGDNIQFVTHKSLEKYCKYNYHIVVVDEVHLLSQRQKQALNDMAEWNKDSWLIALSGSLSKKTEKELMEQCGLPVVVSYTIDQAIEDGLISDYRIHIVKTPLDNSVKYCGKKLKTEKEYLKSLQYVEEQKGKSMFLSLKMIEVFKNSIAKTKKARELLEKLQDKRVLVFTGNNKSAQALGIKIHTAKFNNQRGFEEFVKDITDNPHLAVCKIGNTGVSFINLETIVITSIDSNCENLAQRICRSLILDHPEKISHIYIVVSDEMLEGMWLQHSLAFFNSKKINYE